MRQGDKFLKKCPVCDGAGEIPPRQLEIIDYQSEFPDDGSNAIQGRPPARVCDRCNGDGQIEDYFEREYNPEDDER